MSLLRKNQQIEVSEQRGMPVEIVADSQHLASISESSITLQFYTGDSLGDDAGEAAGTIAIAKLTQGGILNQAGDVIGTNLDSSLSFISTAFTNEVRFPYHAAEIADTNTGPIKAAAITSGFSNGDYTVDYRTGTIYGVKADASFTITTVTYNVAMQTAGGSSTISGNSKNMLYGSDFDGAALTPAVTEGQETQAKGSLNGIQYVMLVNEDGSSQPAYDTGTDSNKTFEINPISEHHEESTLADVTNGTDNTYNYYVDMDGFRSFSLQSTLSGGSGTVTVTVEATNQDDGTAAASCTYVDVTNTLFGVASTTSSAFWFADTAPLMKYLKVKVVAATGGSNDADWTLYFKKAY